MGASCFAEAASKRVAASLFPMMRKACVGSEMPFRSSVPTSSYSNVPRARSRTFLLTRMVPGSVQLCRRAAMFKVSPTRFCSPEAITTMPVAIPIRTLSRPTSGTCIPASVSMISRPAWIARSASPS
jgi:hypothetical protein